MNPLDIVAIVVAIFFAAGILVGFLIVIAIPPFVHAWSAGIRQFQQWQDWRAQLPPPGAELPPRDEDYARYANYDQLDAGPPEEVDDRDTPPYWPGGA